MALIRVAILLNRKERACSTIELASRVFIYSLTKAHSFAMEVIASDEGNTTLRAVLRFEEDLEQEFNTFIELSRLQQYHDARQAYYECFEPFQSGFQPLLSTETCCQEKSCIRGPFSKSAQQA